METQNPAFNFKDDIVLENTRARLEPLQPKHFSALAYITSQNPGLLKYSPTPIEPQKNFDNYVETAITARENAERYAFAIFDKQRNEIAGSTSFGNISNTDQRLEIGWTWMGRNFQSTGLNTAIKSLMLQYAFEILNFKRVEFRIHSQNLQSRKAVEKIGGKFEGELRSHILMPDGSRRDTVYYSILDNEWPIIKANIFNL